MKWIQTADPLSINNTGLCFFYLTGTEIFIICNPATITPYQGNWYSRGTDHIDIFMLESLRSTIVSKPNYQKATKQCYVIIFPYLNIFKELKWNILHLIF